MSDINIEGKNLNEITEFNFQTVGPYTDDSQTEVIEPWQGRKIINNEEQDKRFSLGTYTENNRDFWEKNTFDDVKVESLISDEDLQLAVSELKETGEYPSIFGDETELVEPDIMSGKGLYAINIGALSFRRFELFSVDALAFTKKDTEDGEKTYPLCFYYDKKLQKEEYQATSDNKVYLKIAKRGAGRFAPSGNINDYYGYHNPFQPRPAYDDPIYVEPTLKTYFIENHNWGINFELVAGVVEITWDTIPLDKFKYEKDGEEFDWDVNLETQLVYRLEAAKHAGGIGYEDFRLIGQLIGSENEFSFDSTIGYHEFDQTYKFRIRAQIDSPNPIQDSPIYSNYGGESESSGGIETGGESAGQKGLVKVILSSTRDDNISPAEGTEEILSFPNDNTISSSMTISAAQEDGYQFDGWRVLPPNQDTTAIQIDNPDDLGPTTITWNNYDAYNAGSEDITELAVHADYTPIQQGYGAPVTVTVYAGNGGSVNVPGVTANSDGAYVFELSFENQTQEIRAFANDGKDPENWRVENWTGMEDENDNNEVGIVGFGPWYIRYEYIIGESGGWNQIKWNNAGNYNEGNASVRATFGTPNSGGKFGNGRDDAPEDPGSLINTEIGQGN